MNCPHCGKPVTIALTVGGAAVGSSSSPAAAPAARGPEFKAPGPVCPDHKRPWEHRSGVSPKTGKPYSFWKCPEKGADGKWCRWQPAEEPAVPAPTRDWDLEELA